MQAFLLAWQEGPLGIVMRTSPLAYPVAEILHIIGFALLIGSIVGLDLRLLGFGRALPVATLARLVLPVTRHAVPPRLMRARQRMQHDPDRPGRVDMRAEQGLHDRIGLGLTGRAAGVKGTDRRRRRHPR